MTTIFKKLLSGLLCVAMLAGCSATTSKQEAQETETVQETVNCISMKATAISDMSHIWMALKIRQQGRHRINTQCLPCCRI